MAAGLVSTFCFGGKGDAVGSAGFCRLLELVSASMRAGVDILLVMSRVTRV